MNIHTFYGIFKDIFNTSFIPENAGSTGVQYASIKENISLLKETLYIPPCLFELKLLHICA